MTGKRVSAEQLSKAIIPNAITGCSIFAGYLSIAESLSGEYVLAAWCILIACFLDLFDGRIARAMNATSDFGIQFDSLADLFNYGAAPSLLFYLLYFQDWGIAGVAIAFLPVICAAIRLARFNVSQTPETRVKHFVGLPTTGAAVFLASFIIFANNAYTDYGAARTAAVLLVTAALLMVSPVRFPKNAILSPHRVFKDKRAIASIAVMASIIVFPTTAFFFWSLLYIVLSLLRGFIMIVRD